MDDTGAVTDQYSYDVFGAIRAQSGTSANPWLFTGEQQDGESGLYYLRARFYDPQTGRFLSADPAGAGYPYAYVGNSPVNFVDPSGLHCRPWHPHHCPGEVIDTLGDAYECVANPVTCAVDQFIGSQLDRELVDKAGDAAKALADSDSQFVNKEGGINLIQNCNSTFCGGLFAGTRTPNCVTIGNTILCKSSCEAGSPCFRHESTHVRQYRDLGLLGFYQEYYGSDPKNALKCLASGEFKGLFGCVYRNRPLEKEAFGSE
jgi:RHS repeat-associated protein